MTEPKREDKLAERVREVRRQYDALSPGARAVLKRCRTAGDLRAEGTFWRLLDDAQVPQGERRGMAHVVACFGAADAAKAMGESFGRWLRWTVYDHVKRHDLPARAVRVRRLLAARDRDALVHELGHLLRHGFQKSRRGVDWGPLGADIVYWGDNVRRRWAEQFFTKPFVEESAAKFDPEESSDARIED